jgi:hypothetical protein
MVVERKKRYHKAVKEARGSRRLSVAKLNDAGWTVLTVSEYATKRDRKTLEDLADTLIKTAKKG